MAKFKKGQTVFYNTRGACYRARVERVHRDGTVSILALFQRGIERDLGGYLGFKYRMDARDLRFVA